MAGSLIRLPAMVTRSSPSPWLTKKQFFLTPMTLDGDDATTLPLSCSWKNGDQPMLNKYRFELWFSSWIDLSFDIIAFPNSYWVSTGNWKMRVDNVCRRCTYRQSIYLTCCNYYKEWVTRRRYNCTAQARSNQSGKSKSKTFRMWSLGFGTTNCWSIFCAFRCFFFSNNQHKIHYVDKHSTSL